MAEFSEEIIDGVKVLHLGGSLTQEGLATVEARFRAAATKMKAARVVMDVSKVDAITTPAITMFLSTVRAIEVAGGKVVFAGAKGVTADIFAHCRLDAIFTIATDVTQAVEIAKK